MKVAARGLLVAALAIGLCQAARAEDAKKLESTPQMKAYRANLAAMRAGDYEAYKKGMAKDTVKKMDGQIKEMGKSPKETLAFLSTMTPPEIHATSLKVEGKKATLVVAGKLDGVDNRGTVELAEEDGQWKVGNQSWTDAK
jgi:hypothetical protein